MTSLCGSMRPISSPTSSPPATPRSSPLPELRPPVQAFTSARRPAESLCRALERLSLGQHGAPTQSQITAGLLSKCNMEVLSRRDVKKASAQDISQSPLASCIMDARMLDYTWDDRDATCLRVRVYPSGRVASKVIVHGFPRAIACSPGAQVLAVAASPSCTAFDCALTVTRVRVPDAPGEYEGEEGNRHSESESLREGEGVMRTQVTAGVAVGRVYAVSVDDAGGVAAAGSCGVTLLTSRAGRSNMPCVLRMLRTPRQAAVLSVSVPGREEYGMGGICGLTEYGEAYWWDTRVPTNLPVWSVRIGPPFADNTVAVIRTYNAGDATTPRGVYASTEGTRNLALWDVRVGSWATEPAVSYAGLPPPMAEWCYDTPFARVFDVEDASGPHGLLAAVADDAVVRFWDAARGGAPLAAVPLPLAAGRPLRVQFAGWRAGAPHCPGLWVDTSDALIALRLGPAAEAE